MRGWSRGLRAGGRAALFLVAIRLAAGDLMVVRDALREAPPLPPPELYRALRPTPETRSLLRGQELALAPFGEAAAAVMPLRRDPPTLSGVCADLAAPVDAARALRALDLLAHAALLREDPVDAARAHLRMARLGRALLDCPGAELPPLGEEALRDALALLGGALLDDALPPVPRRAAAQLVEAEAQGFVLPEGAARLRDARALARAAARVAMVRAAPGAARRWPALVRKLEEALGVHAERSAGEVLLGIPAPGASGPLRIPRDRVLLPRPLLARLGELHSVLDALPARAVAELRPAPRTPGALPVEEVDPSACSTTREELERRVADFARARELELVPDPAAQMELLVANEALPSLSVCGSGGVWWIDGGRWTCSAHDPSAVRAAAPPLRQGLAETCRRRRRQLVLAARAYALATGDTPPTLDRAGRRLLAAAGWISSSDGCPTTGALSGDPLAGKLRCATHGG